jgi:hypothetical protein
VERISKEHSGKISFKEKAALFMVFLHPGVTVRDYGKAIILPTSKVPKSKAWAGEPVAFTARPAHPTEDTRKPCLGFPLTGRGKRKSEIAARERRGNKFQNPTTQIPNLIFTPGLKGGITGKFYPDSESGPSPLALSRQGTGQGNLPSPPSSVKSTMDGRRGEGNKNKIQSLSLVRLFPSSSAGGPWLW